MNSPCTCLCLESLVCIQSNFSSFRTTSEDAFQNIILSTPLPTRPKDLPLRKHVFHKVLQQFPLYRCVGLLATTQQHATAVRKSIPRHFSAIDAWCKPGPKSNMNFIVEKHVMWIYGPGATVHCNKPNPDLPLFEQHQLLLQACLVSSSVWVCTEQCAAFL